MTAHSFSLACECGATIGMSPGVTNVTEDMELDVIHAWEKVHSGLGHERVSCAEARKIRNSEQRKQYSNAWMKNNPEKAKAIQARYRQRKRQHVAS